MLIWQCKSFNELTNEELYKIIQLRIEVFAVEQNVVYQDCDDKDFVSYHFYATLNNEIAAYSRIIPPGISYPDAALIGRVATSSNMGGRSLGKQLFEKALEQLYQIFGQIPIIISAQVYLTKFYENFSFIQQGDVYIEDSIPHITMHKNF